MTGEIITLKDYRTAVRDSKNHVTFPQLYRVTGFCFDDRVDALVPTDNPGLPSYTLDGNSDCGWANATRTPIKGFDASIDKGWLFIRHHMRAEFVEGYLDAHMDYDIGRFSESEDRLVFRTEKGLFTLARRTPTEGAPDSLVIYVTKIADPSINHPIAGQFSNGWIDHYTIVLPDGTVTEDSDILYNPDDDE